ncbi:hypothetical protein DL96DRAFT_1678366 [Flagelloscypha sp. PMI_526]|nr:hypothetical protein DL96DRAFT_1678366 [Flagelloscypha sp. PMI_526]
MSERAGASNSRSWVGAERLARSSSHARGWHNRRKDPLAPDHGSNLGNYEIVQLALSGLGEHAQLTSGANYAASNFGALTLNLSCCARVQLSIDNQVGVAIHQFSTSISNWGYFKGSTTILAFLNDGHIWQSNNEGHNRAYLLTNTSTFYWTTDTGATWIKALAPSRPNTFGHPVLNFHPNSDYLIWLGEVQFFALRVLPSLIISKENCSETVSADCHAVAWYSTSNGHKWTFLEQYIKTCSWTSDDFVETDPNQIICESYAQKSGNQKEEPGLPDLITAEDFYQRARQRNMLQHIISFTRHNEFMVVTTIDPDTHEIELQISPPAFHWATAQFPPSTHPQNHTTILDSTTRSLFTVISINEHPLLPLGNLLKSNAYGNYFSLSLEGINRNIAGHTDFEKIAELPGIAIANIVSNIDSLDSTESKILQSRISFNDGARWEPLLPPMQDSLGRPLDCVSPGCALHLHGRTSRRDPDLLYSTPSNVGLLVGVGNVGGALYPYEASSTFLSRDAGHTWMELFKAPYLYSFGDSGSLLVMSQDAELTDHVIYSVDQGTTWTVFKFSQERMRIKSIINASPARSHQFLLVGEPAYIETGQTIVVHLDFENTLGRKCNNGAGEAWESDFEWWNPANKGQPCTLGQRIFYQRRKQTARCWAGNSLIREPRIDYSSCPCIDDDFECEFNHFRSPNTTRECILHEGAEPLPDDKTYLLNGEYWFERTPYRKISYSSCQGGSRLDRGPAHKCVYATSPFMWREKLSWWLLSFISLIMSLCLVTWWYGRYWRNFMKKVVRCSACGGGSTKK